MLNKSVSWIHYLVLLLSDSSLDLLEFSFCMLIYCSTKSSSINEADLLLLLLLILLLPLLSVSLCF